VIRRAESEDADTLATLFRRSYGTLTFLPTLHTPKEDRAHFAKVVATQDVWLDEENGNILGFVALEGGAGTFLYVAPEAHGRGVGSRLFEQAQRARPGGFSFWAFKKNERARRFYEKRGCVAIEPPRARATRSASPT
jgi:putative acetyltransferase